MSWFSLLAKTYDNLMTLPPESREGLLPSGHSTQKAHVEVTLKIDGTFDRADFVADEVNKVKNLSETVIPVTETSANRTNGAIPHPLCDKLKYIAGDYEEYTGEDNLEYYSAYTVQLEDWAKSEYATPKVIAIYNYIKKGTLIKNLVEAGILSLSDGKLTKKFENSNVKLSLGDQCDAFVRFRVLGDGDISAVWLDKTLQQSFIDYYGNCGDDMDFCYVDGKIERCTVNHPKKIRNSADMAKLISANDTSGFTFRGRFQTSEQAVRVGYEASQKMHNALKFLIKKQGERIGDTVFLLWGTKNENTPCLNGNTLDFIQTAKVSEDTSEYGDTRENFAKEFNKAIAGYRGEIDFTTEYSIIGLDAATTGRMSVVFYREYLAFQASELIDRIKLWHESAAWYHTYAMIDGKHRSFYGAPSPSDIAECAFGTYRGGYIDCDAKIKSQTVSRLMPCITDGAKVPRDVCASLVKKCYSPPHDSKDYYPWLKVLSVTCSIYRKYLYDYKGVNVSMELDTSCKDISYNCGRLLAVADEIERYALSADDVQRETNAMRYFTRFSRVPCTTWAVISDKLVPYQKKLGAKANHLNKMLSEISSCIDEKAFATARNLDGRMALGFSSQKKAIYDRNIESHNKKTEDK